MESGSGTGEIEGGGYFGEGTNERTNERSASHVARTISPGTQCGSRSWAEIIRFECTLAAAVGNSVISGHPAYNGYHNGIKHNASINVNNNRAPAGVTGRVDGASERASERAPNVQGATPSSLHPSTFPVPKELEEFRLVGINYLPHFILFSPFPNRKDRTDIGER